MSILIALLIPIIVSFILWLIMYKNCNNKSLSILFVPTLFCIAIAGAMYVGFVIYNTIDTEYLNFYVEKIRYEEPWNEEVEVRKTRTDKNSDGSTSEETYVTYETKYHPAKYTATLNNEDDVYIDADTYYKYKHLWNVEECFIDMHRHYHTQDGDAYECNWDNNVNTIIPYVTSHHYTNKVLGSESAFKLNYISDKDAQELCLYDYPEVHNGEQNPIICYNNKFINDTDIKYLQTFNALNGYDKQIMIYMLIYPNEFNASIVEDQRSYWQGGNKNEFIICCGIDTLTNKVNWAECFSWQDDITLDVNCRNYINTMDSLNVIKVVDYLNDNIDLWHRKEFSDFAYLSVPISTKQTFVIYGVIILITVLSSFIIYKNNG